MRLIRNAFEAGFLRSVLLAPILWALLHLILSRSHDTVHAQPTCTLGSMVWRTVDDFQLAPGQRAEPQRVWVAPNGDVYVVGVAEQNSAGFPLFFDGHWIVRKSSDLGQTWSTVRVSNCPVRVRRRSIRHGHCAQHRTDSKRRHLRRRPSRRRLRGPLDRGEKHQRGRFVDHKR